MKSLCVKCSTSPCFCKRDEAERARQAKRRKISQEEETSPAGPSLNDPGIGVPQPTATIIEKICRVCATGAQVLQRCCCKKDPEEQLLVVVDREELKAKSETDGTSRPGPSRINSANKRVTKVSGTDTASITSVHSGDAADDWSSVDSLNQSPVVTFKFTDTKPKDPPPPTPEDSDPTPESSSDSAAKDKSKESSTSDK